MASQGSQLSARGQAAVSYVERGWSVFPVAPIGEGSGKKNGKEPYPSSHGFRDASNDVERVKAWWVEQPVANIGLSLSASGLVALDVDEYDDPKAWEIFRASNEIPDTFTQSTASGGSHYVYQAEAGRRYPGNVPGMPGEVKHQGYIVLAPSVASSKAGSGEPGCYEMLDDRDPVPAPAWLTKIDRTASKRRLHRDRSAVELVRSRFQDGSLVEMLQQRENTIPDRETWLKVLHGVHFEHVGTHLEDGAWTAFLDWSLRWDGPGRENRHTAEQLRQDAEYQWDHARADHADPVRGSTAAAILRGQPSRSRIDSACLLTPHRSKPLSEHEPLQWLLGTHYLRGSLSLTVAPGGTGKSLLAITDALSLASGRALLGGRIYGPRRVLYMNGGEDSAGQVDARIDAAMQRHGLTDEDLGGRLFAVGAPKMGEFFGTNDFKLARDSRHEGFLIDTGLIDALIQTLKGHEIDALIIDPLKHFHLVPENDNDLINEVAMVLVQIAQEANCAVEAVHHATKEARSRSDAIGIAQARGASALIDKARTARYLAPMSKENAERLGVDDPAGFVRVTDDKANYGPRSRVGRWFRILGVLLDNGNDEYPEGDTVGVIEKAAVAGDETVNPLAATIAAFRGLLQMQDEMRWSERSRQWIGFALARELGKDVGQGLTKDGRSNSQKKAFAEVTKALADFEQAGFIRVEQKRQRNGNMSPVVFIERTKIEKKLASIEGRGDDQKGSQEA